MELRQSIKKLFKFGRTNIEEVTAKNYTEEMVATMIDQYTATPTRATVDALAEEFGKTARSIIAKLSREGVYVAQPKTTKSGNPIVRKSEIVARIAGQLGVELEAPSLVKASKLDLLMLEDAIVKATS